MKTEEIINYSKILTKVFLKDGLLKVKFPGSGNIRLRFYSYKEKGHERFVLDFMDIYNEKNDLVFQVEGLPNSICIFDSEKLYRNEKELKEKGVAWPWVSNTRDIVYLIDDEN